jgi:hypothetical protein
MIANHTQRIGERKPLPLKSVLDIHSRASHSVQPLHQTINARRVEMGLTVEQVYDRIRRYRWLPGVRPPALPTVGHWFNGTRRPRNMEHLKALCQALDLTVDEAIGSDTMEAQTALEQRMLAVLRDLEPAQAEALLITGEAMRGGRGPKR